VIVTSTPPRRRSLPAYAFTWSSGQRVRARAPRRDRRWTTPTLRTRALRVRARAWCRRGRRSRPPPRVIIDPRRRTVPRGAADATLELRGVSPRVEATPHRYAFLAGSSGLLRCGARVRSRDRRRQVLRAGESSNRRRAVFVHPCRRQRRERRVLSRWCSTPSDRRRISPCSIARHFADGRTPARTSTTRSRLLSRRVVARA